MRRLLSLLALWLASPAFAQVVGGENLSNQAREVVLLAGVPHLPGATVDLNFAAGEYYTQGATGPLTVSRASVGMAQDLSGNWFSFPANTLRRTNQGVLIEENRTNGVRNSIAAGATPGTPGVQPTNWTANTNGNAGTLVVNVVGQGTEGGIPYTDFQFVGTPTGAGFFQIVPENTVTIPATYGQTWSASMFVRMVAGSTANTFGVVIGVNEYTSGGGFVTNSSGAGSISGTILGSSQSNFSRTLTGATTANVGLFFLSSYVAGAVNITLRVGLPQLELNPLIPATVASAVTTASGTGGVNGSGVYTVTGGTCTTQPTLNVTWAAGALTVNSVANAGSCSVLPPSPATLAYASGTATGWTSATVTLTPTDNSAQAFATSPILTSGSAATRAADLISIPVTRGNSLYASGVPTAPITNSNVQTIARIDDGTNNNQMQLARNSGNAAAFGGLAVGGTPVYPTPSGGTWAQNAPGKISGFLSGVAGQVSFNAGAPASSALAGTISPTRLLIGVSGPGTYGIWNGYISRVAVSPSSLLPY